MADKKNLVIKVKYPTRPDAYKVEPSTLKTVTVWHTQRIVWVAGVLAVIIILLCYVLSSDDQEKVATTQITDSQPSIQTQMPGVVNTQPPFLEDKTAADRSPPPPIKKVPADVSKVASHVRLALLTTTIIAKEPTGEIGQALRIKKSRPLTLYYFTELRGMNGKTVYHEWLLNDLSITKQALPIAADRWRISTQHTLDDNAAGNWTVTLTDENGTVLHTKNFAVSIVP